jgi:hypothetical protein
MKRAITAIGIAALVALGACGNKKDGPAATAGSGSAAATTTGGAPPGSAAGSAGPTGAGSGSAADTAAGSGSAAGAGSAAGSGSATVVAVPTEVDFENDASAKITDKNVEAQVQALEKELEAK